ncbi:hypothetical protein BJ508DRAFT_334543 [Ascobolus immersus RN42]|uniref:F-box domain-containing protein n=1 Tax=Ascobolus immersus RN42 TaxID=1160509 RepID=A0A3N4HTF5_ASCIM|nr:hypothetical protein BJ508DRAFT_334543 [Ascobolus immersus RN42]
MKRSRRCHSASGTVGTHTGYRLDIQQMFICLSQRNLNRITKRRAVNPRARKPVPKWHLRSLITRTPHSTPVPIPPSPLPSIFRIPTELLSLIFAHLPSTESYISLSQTCTRLHAISAVPSTRRSFARTWFSSTCNDVTAPRILHYLACYIRLHTIRGNSHGGCSTRKPWGEESSFQQTRRYRSNRASFTTSLFAAPMAPGPIQSWRHVAFAEWEEGMLVDGCSAARRVRLGRLVARIEEEMRRGEVPRGGWTMENVAGVLGVEDVVFAEAVLGLLSRLMEVRESEEYWAEVRVWFGRLQLVRDWCGCVCRVEKVERGVGWMFGEKDLMAWRAWRFGEKGKLRHWTHQRDPFEKIAWPWRTAVLGVSKHGYDIYRA